MRATRKGKDAMNDKEKHEHNVLRQQPSSTYAERYAAGKALRDKSPRTAHADWRPSKKRHDPVEMVLASEKGRLPSVVASSSWTHGPVGVHVLSRLGPHHGGGPVVDALDRNPRPVLWRRTSLQFRRVCHTREKNPLLHQRSRRDSPRTVGVGYQAPRRELGRGLPGQRDER